MAIPAIPQISLATRYHQAAADLDARTREFASRILAEPELYWAPDAEQHAIIWEMFELRAQVTKLRRQYQSEGAELILIGCMAGEHKKCRVRVEGLLCACNCHGRGK